MLKRKILPWFSGSNKVDCRTGFLDVLRIPLTKGLPEQPQASKGTL